MTIVINQTCQYVMIWRRTRRHVYFATSAASLRRLFRVLNRIQCKLINVIGDDQWFAN